MAFNSKVSKELNKELILSFIKKEGLISKVEISKITGISLPSVSKIVDELVDEGRIIEFGVGDSSGGRRPILYKFNGNFKYFIVVIINKTYMSIYLVNLDGDVIGEDKVVIEGADDNDVIFSMTSGISRILNDYNIFIGKLSNICIAAPGYFDYGKNKFLISGIPSIKAIDLHEKLCKKFPNIEIKFVNEIHMKVLGEWTRIKNKSEMKRIVVIDIDRDLREDACFAIIDNGNILKPGRGYLGKIEKDMINMADVTVLKKSGYEEVGKLIHDARVGKTRAITLFTNLLNFLVQTIRHILHYVDPDSIIFHGYIAHQGLIEAVKAKLKEDGLLCEIEKSLLNERATLYGCIEEVLSNLFNQYEKFIEIYSTGF
ncbi:winged helix-turn-helix domain-containing protein [Thermoanaerobacter sp. CM-CNRG TB177]|uniref:ROK family transcriptional regulator n=1 Tax=Thermoanaerobacter sp. CM-CNRG TB177 TaxID=2800659 RepID=UPI001BDF295A|nr:winged helix-turn-helix domain-containing protein [Thermoanaerobacter sp. CM-CNRG TB177]MBT1278748.1 ROK family transcriptional regulator [Thermoanaerobacter sp. CM-CNRG TB177]